MTTDKQINKNFFCRLINNKGVYKISTFIKASDKEEAKTLIKKEFLYQQEGERWDIQESKYNL